MTDGNGEEAARGGGSDEEAAWLDLIGRFDAPAGSPDIPVPWPDRENLSLPNRTDESTAPPAAGGDTEPLTGPRLGGLGDRGTPPDGLDERYGPDERYGLGERDSRPAADAERPWPAADTDRSWPAVDKDRPWPAADTDRSWPAADTDGTSTGWRTQWPPADDAAAAGEDAPGEGPAGTGLLPGAGPVPDGRFVLPGHQPLGMPSPANPSMPSPANPRSWSAPDEDEDEGHFIPPPPPPLPALAPGAKAAWTGLFGGPGYLLVATLAGWSVPGWALFLAIVAFVGGFTVLVLRQGDPPDQDSGSGDGAVV